jgi:hypothetical protein
MNGPKIYPRPDQISALTQGLELPLPEILTDHLKIIAEGLRLAYRDILTSKSRAVTTGEERDVTALMEARLNSMIGQDPFWGKLVLFVARGKESLSFDGSHLEERPDLSIYLTDRTGNFPLIVEAKLIDAAARKTERLYCEKGISRFIKGEYAWGTREAFMVAYVRDGSSIEAKLTPFLSKTIKKDPSVYLVEELPSLLGADSVDLARSKHGRAFAYTHQASPPGTIALWHLWLS